MPKISPKADMRKIFHLHIQKTSGTVLFRGLKRHFGDRLLSYRSDMEVAHHIPEGGSLADLLPGLDAVSGHFFTHAPEIPADFARVTILRNPIARAVSAFNHLKQDTARPRLHRMVQGLEYEEAITRPLLAAKLCNGQTRALVAAAGVDFDSLTDQQAIECAVASLKGMTLVGFQENLRPFYDALREQFGIDVDYSQRINADITRDGMASIEASGIARTMVDSNRLDLFVYFEALQFGRI